MKKPATGCICMGVCIFLEQTGWLCVPRARHMCDGLMRKHSACSSQSMFEGEKLNAGVISSGIVQGNVEKHHQNSEPVKGCTPHCSWPSSSQTRSLFFLHSTLWNNFISLRIWEKHASLLVLSWLVISQALSHEDREPNYSRTP